MIKLKINFSETKEFYKELDSSLKSGSVVVTFSQERPNEKSKLWPRLKKCHNWNLIEAELSKVKSKQDSPITGMISNNMAATLAGGELLLIAWIATLLTGLIFYGIYKGCKVNLKLNKYDDVELEISPA